MLFRSDKRDNGVDATPAPQGVLENGLLGGQGARDSMMIQNGEASQSTVVREGERESKRECVYVCVCVCVSCLSLPFSLIFYADVTKPQEMQVCTQTRMHDCYCYYAPLLLLLHLMCLYCYYCYYASLLLLLYMMRLYAVTTCATNNPMPHDTSAMPTSRKSCRIT